MLQKTFCGAIYESVCQSLNYLNYQSCKNQEKNHEKELQPWNRGECSFSIDLIVNKPKGSFFLDYWVSKVILGTYFGHYDFTTILIQNYSSSKIFFIYKNLTKEYLFANNCFILLDLILWSSHQKLIRCLLIFDYQKASDIILVIY